MVTLEYVHQALILNTIVNFTTFNTGQLVSLGSYGPGGLHARLCHVVLVIY